jgi:hypothetical protein
MLAKILNDDGSTEQITGSYTKLLQCNIHPDNVQFLYRNEIIPADKKLLLIANNSEGYLAFGTYANLLEYYHGCWGLYPEVRAWLINYNTSSIYLKIKHDYYTEGDVVSSAHVMISEHVTDDYTRLIIDSGHLMQPRLVRTWKHSG